MRRAHIISLMALILVLPAAGAASYFGSDSNASTGNSSNKPCFVVGNAGYVLSDAKSARHVIRIDNAAAQPTLRMQLVDSPAEADFVLVDDDANNAITCESASSIESIRIDPAATRPELTVALSRAPADTKIFVRSSRFSDQDAAALFAVMWHKANATGSLRSIAKND
ncbi:MAG TPA: hypothetical protein VIJ78_01750 [Pseudolabrys sp.]